MFDDQQQFLDAFARDEFDDDMVVVVRFQGPKANGMPELHRLTPALGVLQGRGHRVALVTDGRMSGASGKVPAAIHCTPEAADGGPLARLKDGDLIRIDTRAGTLDVIGVDLDGRVRRTRTARRRRRYRPRALPPVPQLRARRRRRRDDIQRAIQPVESPIHACAL